MYKKVTVLTACAAATALLLAVSVAQAADPAEDSGEGGGVAASAADMPQVCKDQAAKRSLTGAEADEYLKKCAAPVGDTERNAVPEDERLEGQL